MLSSKANENGPDDAEADEDAFETDGLGISLAAGGFEGAGAATGDGDGADADLLGLPSNPAKSSNPDPDGAGKSSKAANPELLLETIAGDELTTIGDEAGGWKSVSKAAKLTSVKPVVEGSAAKDGDATTGDFCPIERLFADDEICGKELLLV